MQWTEVVNEGEKVTVFNDRGSFDAVAKITPDVIKALL